ncbi:MAG: signal peptidase I [Planctomycetota bacterium]|nr:MAG: signal peptidase I [Planctomycetota bacterium]
MPADRPQSTRETVESIIVAFILAFLFRAFVAEAFVIPTGSMAPTLMGAHKDLVCQHCGMQYQASASSEFDSDTGALTDQKTVASTCANCRGLNKYDFRHNPNHATFSGDRILVSKFDYVFGEPQRWDVFVFKYPREARMNYIKRLVGLPNEQLQIREGDVYVRSPGQSDWAIARKPPRKIRAMRRAVFDTKYMPSDLAAAGWPGPWHPWPAPQGDAGPWRIEQTASSWQADLAAHDAPSFLRYFHKIPTDDQWQAVEQGRKLPPIDPYSSRLITDYLAYNSRYTLTSADALFELRQSRVDRFLPPLLRRGPRWQLPESVPDEQTALDVALERGLRVQSGYPSPPDGLHWVGDLCAAFDVEVSGSSGTLMVDLVEFGIHFRCDIDVATGRATLRGLDGETALPIFGDATAAQAQTPIKGPGRHRIEMANFDDQVVVWIDGDVVEFDTPTTFDSHRFRTAEHRRPHWTSADPMDAAPVGIGGQGLTMRVHRAQVFRDVYYIAIQRIAGSNQHSALAFTDYMMDGAYYAARADVVPDAAVRATLRSDSEAVAAVYAHPEWWSKTVLFSLRGMREFKLDEAEYFPMGDNSAESSDARAWTGHHYVEQRFLLGKALLIFWPHTWNTPVPYTPNLQRMRLIR